MKPDFSPPLASLLAKLVDCGLNEAEKAKLEDILRKNPAAREYYRLYLATHLELADAAPQMHFAPVASTGRFRRFRLPLAIAALIPLSFGLALWAPWRADRHAPAPKALAVTTATENVRWSLPETPQAGVHLPAGRIQLTAGTLALALSGNQVMTLVAPTDFELINETESFLHRGDASLRIVGAGSPYAIRVPRGTVVDLGTEFSVKVAPEGTTDVWVFEGKALVSLTNGTSTREQQALVAGQSLRIGETLMPSPAKAVDFIRPLLPGVPARESTNHVIADFSAEFPTSALGSGQPFRGTETPATGWNYLWNPTGILGTSAKYQSLVPNTVNTFPAANGGGIFPMFTNFGNLPFNSGGQRHFRYGRIAKTSIHPGKFVPGRDYRAIIAYTIQAGEEGEISIANSSLAKYRVDGFITNGVDLDVFVNDTLVGALSKDGYQSLTATGFNGTLGNLSPGDTVYVTLGNNGDEASQRHETYDAFDACVIDFQLVRDP